MDIEAQWIRKREKDANSYLITYSTGRFLAPWRGRYVGSPRSHFVGFGLFLYIHAFFIIFFLIVLPAFFLVSLSLFSYSVTLGLVNLNLPENLKYNRIKLCSKVQVCTNKDRNILVKTNEEIRVKVVVNSILSISKKRSSGKEFHIWNSISWNECYLAKPLLAFPNPHWMNYPKQLEWSVLCSFWWWGILQPVFNPAGKSNRQGGEIIGEADKILNLKEGVSALVN